MFKEYALYKTNRDMLDKRYSLRTEEQRMKDIEFKHNMNEHKQQLEIEMTNAKRSELEEIEKKADEAAMTKYKDTIERLRKEINDKNLELDKKEEESKLMSVKIEELEEYQSA